MKGSISLKGIGVDGTIEFAQILRGNWECGWHSSGSGEGPMMSYNSGHVQDRIFG